MSKVDVDKLKASISLEDLIRHYGVELVRQGKELRALCPFHSERTPSFTVTPAKQLYLCLGCGAGGDHLQFVMDRESMGFREAAARIVDIAGIGSLAKLDDAPQRASKKAPEPPAEWERRPAPVGAPDPPAALRVRRGGAWVETDVVRAWAYRTAAGELVSYACRVEYLTEDGRKAKDVIPVTWQVNVKSGEERWRQGAMTAPRPLYGAHLLAAQPEAAVIVVEGEKACDAARRILAGQTVVVVTWAGGCKAVEHADWTVLSGRNVALWGDTDSQRRRDAEELLPWDEQPGMVAMLRIAEKLEEMGTRARVIRLPPPGVIADGWDLADAEDEGWNADRLLGELRARIVPRGEVAPWTPPPEPAEDPGLDSLFPPAYAESAIEEEEPAPAERAPRRKRGKGDDGAGDKPAKRPPPQVSNPDDMPAKALGFNMGRYYYLARRQGQVYEYGKSDHSANGLLSLASLESWSTHFAYGGPMKSENWQLAVDAMMRQCEQRGIFDTSILRGRGCWNDRGRLVINLGNRLLVDGQVVHPDAIDSEFIYERAPRMQGPAAKPMSVQESKVVLDIARRFNWEMKGSGALLAGWIALAPLCGVLKWRPHIWITGGTGTGKTTVLEKFVAHLLAGTELRVQGNSTEAGIRQTLRADARPVVFDETEQNNEREADRIQNVLSLVRQASTESGARTYKGTTHGRQLEFYIRSMFCLASIQVGIQRQADHTRIAILSMFGGDQVPQEKQAEHTARWRETDRMIMKLLDDDTFSGRLMARSVAMFPVIEQNVRTLIRVAADEFGNQRLADQYGTLLAGTATLLYDTAITDEGARNLIGMFDWGTLHEGAKEDESRQALSSILQLEQSLEARSGRISVSVGEMVRAAYDGDALEGVNNVHVVAALGRIGLKVIRPMMGQRGALYVANKSDRLAKLLRGNPWAADWRGYLRRIPGASTVAVVQHFSAGLTSRCVSVPMEQVFPAGDRDQGVLPLQR